MQLEILPHKSTYFLHTELFNDMELVHKIQPTFVNMIYSLVAFFDTFAKKEKEKERKRKTEKDREIQRKSEKYRERQRNTEEERDKEKEKDKEIQRKRETKRKRKTGKDIERQRKTEIKRKREIKIKIKREQLITSLQLFRNCVQGKKCFCNYKKRQTLVKVRVATRFLIQWKSINVITV